MRLSLGSVQGPIGTYIADRQLVRYYIDGEAAPSLEFEPAMACGSGIGYERLGYYEAGHNMKEPWGPEMSNTMMGHSARSGGGWHNRFKVPFARSIRVTVELPLDVYVDLAVAIVTTVHRMLRPMPVRWLVRWSLCQ